MGRRRRTLALCVLTLLHFGSAHTGHPSQLRSVVPLEAVRQQSLLQEVGSQSEEQPKWLPQDVQNQLKTGGFGETLGVITERCVEEPLSSFAQAGAAMTLCMAAVAMLIWLLSAPCMPNPRETSRPLNPSPKVRMDALDGLRTVLVTYVIISHQESAMEGLQKRIFSVQHWPMQFFFVLSGFVMCHVGERKLVFYDWDATSAFIARRLARLCPAYMLALSICFVEQYAGATLLNMPVGRPFLSWPVQALFLQTLFPVQVCGVERHWWGEGYIHLGGDGAGWFTSAIVFLSFCFPILFNLRPQRGHALTLCLLVAVVVLRSVPTVFFRRLPMQGEGLDIYGFAPLRVLEFSAGILAATLSEQLPRGLLAWHGWGWVFDAAMLFAVLVAFVLPLPIADMSEVSALTIDSRTPPHGDFLLTGVFCVACIAARGVAEPTEHDKAHSAGMFCTLLSSPTLVSMAEYSFAAYIMQVPLKQVTPCPQFLGVIWPIYLAICWIVGRYVCEKVEAPVRMAVERRLKGPLFMQAPFPACGDLKFAAAAPKMPGLLADMPTLIPPDPLAGDVARGELSARASTAPPDEPPNDVPEMGSSEAADSPREPLATDADAASSSDTFSRAGMQNQDRPLVLPSPTSGVDAQEQIHQPPPAG